MDTTVSGPVGPEVGHTALIGSLTARTMLPTEVTEGRLSIVEHYLDPKEPGAPLHRHSREDEYTVVVQGWVGVLLGEDVYEAGPGELVLKPRGQWHTFWNPGQDRARLLEIISPAGFEQFFQDIAPFFPQGAAPDLEKLLVRVGDGPRLAAGADRPLRPHPAARGETVLSVSRPDLSSC